MAAAVILLAKGADEFAGGIEHDDRVLRISGALGFSPPRDA